MTLTLYMSPHCLSPHPSPSLSLNVFVAFFLLSNNSPSGPFSLYLSIHSLHICLFHPFWVQMLSKSLTAWVWHQLPLRSMRLTSDLGGDEYVCMCCFESFHHAHYTFHHSSASFYSETKSAFNCMFALHIKASLVVVFIFFGGGGYSSWTFSEVFQITCGLDEYAVLFLWWTQKNIPSVESWFDFTGMWIFHCLSQQKCYNIKSKHYPVFKKKTSTQRLRSRQFSSLGTSVAKSSLSFCACMLCKQQALITWTQRTCWGCMDIKFTDVSWCLSMQSSKSQNPNLKGDSEVNERQCNWICMGVTCEQLTDVPGRFC